MELLTAAASEAVQRRVAGGLLARGLHAGDRIELRSSTSASTMLSAVLGALRVGIVPVVLNAGLLEHERRALIADADPQLQVDDGVLAALIDGPPADLAPAPLARPMHYTSGTTGVPKGVWSGVLDEREAIDLVEEEADLWGFDASDVHLVCSPMHHSVAIRFAGTTLLRGGSVVVLDRFDAAAACRAIAEHRPTTTFMVPAHLQRLFALDAHPDLTCVRLLAHAGAPCPTVTKQRAIDAFGVDCVWEFYGSTEGQFTACSAPEWLDRPGTVGRARPLRRLAVDPGGVIWCEVPAYARFEYWRDPQRTAEAWRRDADGLDGRPDDHHPDPHGWFTVGDVGRIDRDGYLFLDGRRDDLVITGGVNVYPAEVENALAGCAGVAQVAVFGVDDERWGQRVCAAIVGDAEPAEVLAYSRTVLAAYKCPKDVYRVEDLPHTSTGKLQRGRVAASLGLAT